MTLSIRNILIGIFLLLSAAVCVLTGTSMVDAYGSYRVYSNVSQLAALDKAMFQTLVNFRNERGNGVSSLKLDIAAQSGTVETMKSDRAHVDEAIAQAKSIDADLDNAELNSQVSGVAGIFDRWLALRAEIDGALAKPLADRDPKLADASLELGQEFLTALEAASAAIEAHIRVSDPSMTAMIQVRSLSWSTRALTGAGILIVNTSLADGKPMPAESLTKIQMNDNTVAFVWKQVGALVNHAGTPDDVKQAFEAADSTFFKGDFAAARSDLLEKFKSGAAAPMSLDDWRPRSTAALKVLSNVPSVAVDAMTHDAAGSQQHALTTTLGFLSMFVAALALSVAGICVIIFRVVRPIGALTRSMGALADGNLKIFVPGVQRGDEIGEMARSVEVFKEAAVRNAALEAEAEAARLASERDRVEVQRRAEAEAEERLSQATGSLATGLRRLASGDLLCEIETQFAQQFESLRQDFNTSVRQLRDAMRGVGQAASLVTVGSAEISQASDNLSKRTEQQAASLEETAAALEQVTANVQSTSKRAGDARDLVRGARSRAENSSQVVNNAVNAMEKIEHSSRQISQIIGVIDEIAFQTNLLALNAGVEAARAGDAGKGFAVVAQEVRELAQRSANAAKEIKGLIGNSEIAVSEGVKLVNDTGEGLSAIAELVQQINQHMDAIATAAQEQSMGLTEINSAVNHMDQATQQNAAMVEEMNAAGAGLAQESNRLGELLSSFRTGTADAPVTRTAAARPAPVAIARASAPQMRTAPAARGNAALNKLQQEWTEF